MEIKIIIINSHIYSEFVVDSNSNEFAVNIGRCRSALTPFKKGERDFFKQLAHAVTAGRAVYRDDREHLYEFLLFALKVANSRKSQKRLKFMKRYGAIALLGAIANNSL